MGGGWRGGMSRVRRLNFLSFFLKIYILKFSFLLLGLGGGGQVVKVIFV